MDLLSLFKRGLIPGPSETEEAFLLRASSRPPLPDWNDVPPLPSAWGFSIDWVPLSYSSKKLLPWEGAIFWDTPLIQLHPALQTKTLFGNSLSDILHHESIHAAREAFHEPAFEEILAYSVSRSPWKRFFGPLFQRIWEFPLFAAAFFFLSFFPLVSFPILSFFVLRLFYKQLLFYRLKKKLPLPILLCLTDREIRTLALTTAKLTPDSTLRGQLIAALLSRR
jgi:hypothetical protein